MLGSSVMKAAAYSETGPPEVFRYTEVPDPVCAPDGVVVDVGAISLEGGDTLNRLGGLRVTQPQIVGYPCAGRVCGVGEKVGDLSVGDRVVCIDQLGSHAEERALPAGWTRLVPESLELERAACVPIALGMNHGIDYRGTDFVPATRSLPEAAQAHAFIESRQAFGRVFLIP